MKCIYCGNELKESDAFCTSCGKSVIRDQNSDKGFAEAENNIAASNDPVNDRVYYNDPTVIQTTPNTKYNVLSIVGLCLSGGSFLFSLFGLTAIAGIVLSILALLQINKTGEKGKVLAIIGICLGGAGLLFGIIAMGVLFTSLSTLGSLV